MKPPLRFFPSSFFPSNDLFHISFVHDCANSASSLGLHQELFSFSRSFLFFFPCFHPTLWTFSHLNWNSFLHPPLPPPPTRVTLFVSSFPKSKRKITQRQTSLQSVPEEYVSSGPTPIGQTRRASPGDLSETLALASRTTAHRAPVSRHAYPTRKLSEPRANSRAHQSPIGCNSTDRCFVFTCSSRKPCRKPTWKTFASASACSTTISRMTPCT